MYQSRLKKLKEETRRCTKNNKSYCRYKGKYDRTDKNRKQNVKSLYKKA